jgi:hypothetical protein
MVAVVSDHTVVTAPSVEVSVVVTAAVLDSNSRYLNLTPGGYEREERRRSRSRSPRRD